MTDNDIDDAFGHWYIPGRKARFVRRNALVAVGNTASHDDIALLAGYVGHPDALLRGHAAWALGRLGGSMAMRVLTQATRSESDASVRAEIDAAINL